jgi:hypothetical protein
MLFVPSAKTASGPVTPLDPVTVDHFKCYRAKGARTRVSGVEVRDQFGTIILDVKRPFRLCAPVDKNSEGTIDPDSYLMCYEVRIGSASPGFTPAGHIFINNQFGDDSFESFRVRELCVPSVVLQPDNLTRSVGDAEEAPPPSPESVHPLGP